MRQEFTIPGRLANLNEFVSACNTQFNKGNKLKRSQEDTIMWAIKASRIKPVQVPVFVRFLWVEPNKRRDKDNIAFAKKFILDALQKAHILKNDGWGHVVGFEDKFDVDKSNPRIVVEIEEIDGTE